ncbi:MAG: DUF481 domain-containing protein [Pseudomonadota bacterium]
MRSIFSFAAATAFGLSLTATTFAEEAADPAADGWTGSIGAGLVMTGGNTETESGNAVLDITRSIGAWSHNLNTSALWTADSVRTTAEKYYLSFQSNRALSDKSYLFGVASYDDDRFSSFDYQASAALGYGYHLIANDSMNLKLEAGPGYRVSAPFIYQTDAMGMNVADANTGLPIKIGVGPKDNELIGRFAESFDWQFSDNAKLIQELNVEAGSDNTVTRFLVAVETNVVGSIALRVSYGIKNNTDVAPGLDKTDTETAITLAYGF